MGIVFNLLFVMYRIRANNLIDKTNDVIVLIGPRQVGKTTLLKNVLPEAKYINLETYNYVDLLNSRDVERIKERFLLEIDNYTHRNKQVLILDEFQRLNDPGLIAKVIHDEIPQIKLVITGSSALELTFQASESLAGRKRTKLLFPLTFSEKLIQSNVLKESQIGRGLNFNLKSSSRFRGELLESMRYGMYPELLNRKDEKEEYLIEYVDSILLKDIYFLGLVKDTSKLEGLLKLLAYQVGQLVNISDIANRLGIARQTVENYIDILKKSYVVFSLKPFTKKRRDEIGKTEKIYFYDLGLRNALISDFSPVEYRRDYGHLFENFVISEVMKLNNYYGLRYMCYYWRTKWGSEVDLILVKDGKIRGIEIKASAGSVSSGFTNTYEDAATNVITLDNLASVILGNAI